MAQTNSHDSQTLPLSDGQQPIGPWAASLTILTAVLWGGTPVAVRYSVEQLPPVAVSGIRFLLAAVFMLFWCRLEGSSLKLRAGQVVPSIIMGLLLFVQISLFTLGIKLSNASHSIVLINTFIFWVAGIEYYVTRTIRLTPGKILGLLLAAAGGLFVVALTGTPGAEQDKPTTTGDLIVLASAVVLGVKIVYTKRAAMRVEPGKLIFWHDVIGVVLFFAWSFAFETPSFVGLRMPTLLGLLYQGLVVAGFCFAVQAYLLRRHSASKIAVYSGATPLFGILLASMFRGDPLSAWLLVSGALVAIGIWLVNTERSN